jgi:hypothetical protein
MRLSEAKTRPSAAARSVRFVVKSFLCCAAIDRIILLVRPVGRSYSVEANRAKDAAAFVVEQATIVIN